MRLATLYHRSLIFHRRMHVAVGLGVIVAASALTGALMVGDSMRASLRAFALDRLGNVELSLITPTFFTQNLAESIETDLTAFDAGAIAEPAVLLSGGVTHADSDRRAGGVNIVGVRQSFWKLGKRQREGEAVPNDRRSCVISEALADEIGASPGDAILLRVGKPSDISTETLLGRRDDTTATLRLTVQNVLTEDDGLGIFSLNPKQVLPKNVFVTTEAILRATDHQDAYNALLVGRADPPSGKSRELEAAAYKALVQHIRLEDLGLKLRTSETHDYVALESDSILIDPVIETAARKAAGKIGAPASGILTHLANAITIEGQSDSGTIPYSTIAAIEPGSAVAAALFGKGSALGDSFAPGKIVLNDWAATDLGARTGDRIAVRYYTTSAFGQLVEKTASFELAGIIPLESAAADPGFIPEYPGVTDTESLSEWNAPFPVNLDLVRDKDEQYWKDHKTTPKAFVALSEGQSLWAGEGERLGRITSVRMQPKDQTLDELAAAFRTAYLREVDLGAVSMRFDPVRATAEKAGAGSTDFGGLFIGFSLFLIGAGLLLIVLLFRLGVERRAKEVGLLLATGFTPRRTGRALLAEGVLVSALGAGLALGVSIGYAWLMLAGLKSWWSGAVNSPFLRLSISETSLATGYLISVIVAAGAIAWAVRAMTAVPAYRLLRGSVETTSKADAHRKRTRSVITAIVALLAAIALSVAAVATDDLPRAPVFFGSGALTLIAALSAFRVWLLSEHGGKRLPKSMTSLGIRSAPRSAGRSMMTAALIASAVFVIASLEAFRLDAGGADSRDKNSPAGGFPLFAESAAPILFDLQSPEGQEALAVTQETRNMLTGGTVAQFRLRPGDEASCLNLYLPQKPRIVGATTDFIERGGFQFASTIANDDAAKTNPWKLLESDPGDRAIPVIGDESAVLWQLHSGLGKDLHIADERGEQVTLRFVALLRGSALQDELVISEANFKKLFPTIEGYRFFLLAPDGSPELATTTLEADLSRFGFDVATTASRLQRYLAVQNTYLSTFQTLGGIGLILGTLGMAVVLLRNVWERRGELALMRAVGFSRAAISRMVFGENLLLLLVGLGSGGVSALVAILPSIVRDATQVPWASFGVIFALVLAVGMSAGALAVRSAVSLPLIPSLRRE